MNVHEYQAKELLRAIREGDPAALEQLARQVDRRFNPDLGRALDVASGAVLCMAIGAVVVGLVVFVPYVWAMIQSGTEAM